MRSSSVNLLKRMVEIYSPTGKELELSNFLIEEMKSLGFETGLDEAGNVIGKFGRKNPAILLCGHMDTVPGELQVRVEGDRLYGRGLWMPRPH